MKPYIVDKEPRPQLGEWLRMREVQDKFTSHLVLRHDLAIARAIIAGRIIVTVEDCPHFTPKAWWNVWDYSTTYYLEGRDDAHKQKLVETAKRLLSKHPEHYTRSQS